MSSQAASSRSVSSPGSTTAPCGSFAIVSISAAVAGIEPVEPAAITGPSVRAASRCASAAISRSRRSAGSILPRSARIAGHASRTIRSGIERELPVVVDARRAPASSSLSHGTCRVVMSSISRASASASASAEAGIVGDQRRVAVARHAWRAAHFVTAASAAAGARGRRARRADRARSAAVGGVGEHQLVLVDVADRRRCAAGSRRRRR